MENVTQLPEDVVAKSVRRKQNIAAALFIIINVATIAYLCLSSFLGTVIFPHFDALLFAIEIVAFCVLSRISSNKATKVATYILLGVSTLNIILYFIFSIFLSDTMENYHIINEIRHIINLLMALVSLYGFSLILRANKGITAYEKSWININIILMMLTVFLFISLHVRFLVYGSFVYEVGGRFVGYVVFQAYRSYLLWYIVLRFLQILAVIPFVKCAAFAGGECKESGVKGVYSPLNKYFLSLLVASVVAGVLWAILYSNVDAAESILLSI